MVSSDKDTIVILESRMQYDLFKETKYKFLSLGSGSSGNCYYLGTSDYGILIDVGIGIRTVKKTLREYGIALEKIMGVLVTHEHADHIKTVGAMGDKLGVPIYATDAVHDGIRRNKYLNAQLHTTRKVIEKEITFSIKDFQITAFDVPHDSLENVGYEICFDEQKFVLITDIGRITDTIYKYAREATHLVIEANYDEEMLRNGKYPYHLKQRIASGMGHLSNRLSADFIADIYNERMQNIWLCHLSQDNNHPELAYNTIEDALQRKGIMTGKDVSLQVLSRYKASGLKEF